MANMSAQILRNIVSSVFNVKAQNVILSGEISPECTLTGNTCWSSQTTETHYELFGFNPKTGFVNLNNFVGNWHNATDGTAHGNNGTMLCDIPNVADYVFFLIKEDVRAYNEEYSYEKWELYKAPNFQEHWAAIEAEDIARWEEWLNPVNENTTIALQKRQKSYEPYGRITRVLNYTQLRDLYDSFGSVFFGIVRALNIAHQGWMYEFAFETAQNFDTNDTNGVMFPSICEKRNGKWYIEYTSRSGKLYIIHHKGENEYYDIEVSMPEDSSLAEVFTSL